MARHGDYLYRRNGRFYARLRIPRQLQDVYGKPDLRVSLDTTHYSDARLRVLEVVLGWKRDFLRARTMIDTQRLVRGSPLLVGEGLLTIGSASREAGIPVLELVREAVNRRLELRVQATGWWGTDVPASELEYEQGGSLEVGSYSPSILVVNAASDQAKVPVTGALYICLADLALGAGEANFETCLLFRDHRRTHAVVFQLPGVSVPIDQLLIERADAEKLRQDLAARVTPDMLKAAQVAQAAIAAAAPSHKHKYAAMRSSELLKKFFDAKASDWGPATKIEMQGKCQAFIDLMTDPLLGDIDGGLVLEYRQRLAQLPAHVGRAKHLSGAATFTELLAFAEDKPKMKESRVLAYLAKLSEFLGWAAVVGFMPNNPANGVMKRPKRARRQQDERQPMSQENLWKIFSVDWFQSGRGKRTAKGLHYEFQPAFYWLPLLGLFVGGRLNELSQLYLDDIKQTTAGQGYIHFNVDRPDKRNLDDQDLDDKRLKTINAIRVVPVHPVLVRLGLLNYVAALRQGGYERLFPELRYDKVKGYSKQSSRWFNDLFMKNRLNIVRDNTQVFHSFRHNFITCLMHLEVPELVVSELAGHERGETMAGKRYTHDREADRLAPFLERLYYELPPVAPFDVVDGLLALEAALSRKANHASHRGGARKGG